LKKLQVILTLAILTGICAFKAEEPALPGIPKGWPAPVYDFKNNPLSEAKIALGRALFFDPILSRNNTISCASCHLPQTAFTHVDHDLSHGIDGRIGTRNSPALMNLAWSKYFMWDGAVHHLEVQSLAPITNPLEMDEPIADAVKKLQQSGTYAALYQKAFGDSIVSGEHTLKALSQFMLTFISADAKYDRVMNGQAVFNEYEARGYALFKTNCASCHKEPLFTNGEFENNGLPVDTTLNDIGRMKVTGKETDRGKFKVSTLRNLEVSYPYMHDGRFKSLQMVVFHYTNGIVQSNNLSAQLRKGIVLTEDNKRDLIAFLKTLTDEGFLHNPAFQPHDTKTATL
jgi:cytochrome c peroxidase